MDWLNASKRDLLRQEWAAILRTAKPGARVIWRSGALKVDYVDNLDLLIRGRTTFLGELLHYDYELARKLHAVDRVHTYGSFYIADILAV